MFLKTENDGLFLNLTEFVYTPGAVEALLKCCDKLHEVDKDDVWEDKENMPSSENGQTDKHAQGKSNQEQPSIVSKFPTTVDVAAEYVKQNSFSAQCQRRTETGYSSGVTAQEIREHLLKEVPNLKEHGISVTSTRRLFQASKKVTVSRNIGTDQPFFLRLCEAAQASTNRQI